MPQFYFDTDDGQRSIIGDEGLDLADLDAARTAAVDALPDLARDALPDGDRRTMVVTVRDDRGRIVLTASLTLAVEWASSALR